MTTEPAKLTECSYDNHIGLRQYEQKKHGPYDGLLLGSI